MVVEGVCQAVPDDLEVRSGLGLASQYGESEVGSNVAIRRLDTPFNRQKGLRVRPDIDLVDFNGNVVDEKKLKADVDALEAKVCRDVGSRNKRVHPPPAVKIPKWIEKLLDKWGKNIFW